MARSIVVEAAVHGCIHPGTKGAVMRGIKEEREGEKERKKRRRAKRGRDNREEDEPLEKRGTTGEKMHDTSAPVTRCSFRWWPRNETVPTGPCSLATSKKNAFRFEFKENLPRNKR